MSKAKLFLIPCPIEESASFTIPEYVKVQIRKLDAFVVERAKTARKFIKSIDHPKPMNEIEVLELDKHADTQDWSFLLKALKEGKNVGFISEAGCPGIADPGQNAVNWAHRNDIDVVPLVGPSSILLALMASGLNGQNFAFNGYLPIKAGELNKQLRQVEKRILNFKQTQVFIETPYRNTRLIQSLLKELSDHIKLTIACNITAPNEWIKTKSIKEWKKSNISDLQKQPCIFIVGI